MKAEPGIDVTERAAWVLLCLFVFSMPWEKSVWVPGVGTLTHLLGILAFAAGAISALRASSIRAPNAVVIGAALFVLWSGLTYFWSLDRQATVTRAFTLAELWAMLWLIWNFCRTPARQDQLVQAYVWGATVASSLAFTRYFLHQQTYWRRYAAAGFDPNDFGLILALAVPLGLFLALRAKGAQRWFFRAAILAVLAGILLTASRTALIATFVAFGFGFWTWRQADSSQKISTLALAALLVLGIFQLAPAASRERLDTISNELARGTFHGRTRIWKAGFHVLKKHPVLGVGSGAYPEAVRPSLGTPGVPGFRYVAHNTFLSVLVECGLAGFSIYGILLGLLALFVWTMQPTERALWAVMLATWAVGVSTLTWEHYKPSWLIVALITTEWAWSYWPAARRV